MSLNNHPIPLQQAVPASPAPVAPTLSALYASYEYEGKLSDKWERYLVEYERLLSPYRDRPIRLLEIGVQNGGSLDIWARYFERGVRIIGCDIDPKCADLRFEDPRIDLLVADATTPAARDEIVRRAGGALDVVIEDGSHVSTDIVKAFAQYFPLVAEGGLFIAEDLHCSYWSPFEGGLFEPLSSMSFFKQLTDVINHEHWGVHEKRSLALSDFVRHHGIELDEQVLAQVHSVEFFNSTCVVRKCAPEHNVLGPRHVVGSVARVHVESCGLHGSTSKPPLQLNNPFSRGPTPHEELMQLRQWVAEQEREIAELKARLEASQAAQAEGTPRA